MRLGWSALFLLPVLANDGFIHQSAGNLMFVKNDQVAIQRERLVVGPSRPTKYGTNEIPFHVEYELENLGPSEVDAQIGFPLAACNVNDFIGARIGDFGTGSSATCGKQNPAMSLVVDGDAKAGAWDYVFLKDGAPLQDEALARKLREVFKLIRDPQVDHALDPMFSAFGALCAEQGGRMKDQECSSLGNIFVHWTFIWSHRFAPGAKAHVVHDYAVAASANRHPEDVFKSDVFCLADPSTLSAWKKYRADLAKEEAAYMAAPTDNYPWPREFFTEYVLHTGALWAGPIRDFELVIRKSAPGDLISTCFTGLKKTGPLEFTAHRTGFSPTEDLRILYLPATR
jgi:hypothetical protein